MTDQRLMDPAHFGDRMAGAFGVEPPHADLDADLVRGRRRLRRHRAAVTLGGLAVAAVVSGAAVAVPGALSGALQEQEQGAVAAGGPVSAQEIVATCMRKENVMHLDQAGRGVSEGATLRLMGKPRLMSSAVTDNRVEATLLSEDGTRWGECQFARRPDNGVKHTMSVYPTDVSFPRHVVSGVPAYEAPYVNDPRLEGTATVSIPDFETPCVSPLTDEERWAVDAKCPQFTMHWNDRRPADVAAVRVTTPDGVRSWADVRRGYVSFSYTGRMTPKIAAQVAAGEAPGAQRVVFYDEEGNILVDDRHPGHLPQDGSISIANFPSLAWWTKVKS